jgi:class 3 adenylate cyclase
MKTLSPREGEIRSGGQPDSKAKLAADEGHLEPVEMGRRTLRFKDPKLEREFREEYYRQNLANIRFTLLAGIAMWVIWGLLVREFLVPSDRPFDLTLRFGAFIPMLLIAFALSFNRVYARIWEWVMFAVVGASLITWVFYVSVVRTMPVDYGYVGLILITAFAYALARLRFNLVVLITVIAIGTYIPYAVAAVHIFGVRTVLATAFLLSFGGLWGVAAYRLEKSTRLLFLREHQLEWEHQRSDALLLNILPQAIVDRLKAHPNGERVADAFDEVSVLFADAVGSTEHAAKSSPEEFAETLDTLFRRFDEIADRYGLEKIKTIGDAYMAVAGAPVPVKDHAAKVANAALDMLVEAGEVRWPSGDPVVVRLGMATGPAVAGVIGQRKFAYDLWGDTVNLASRLSETSGVPGRVQVTEPVAERLADRYEFSEPRLVDLKGKGPTPVRFLLSRSPQPASTGSSAGR